MTRVPYAGDEKTEHALGGGNVAAGVVRVGDTVRKPAGFWTPAVDTLLTHLRRAGFTGAPRPLGRDDQGRQVLEYVPGPIAMDQPQLDEAGRTLADGYGLSAGQRAELPPLIGAHTRGMADLLDNGARTGTQPWARLHAEGHGEHWTAAAEYIERNLPAWRRALR